MSALKRKLNNVSLIQKCQIIREIEKGMSNKEAAEKYKIPKNTISTWMKNKHKILQSLEEQKTASGSKKVRGCDYEQIDKAVFKWFTVQRSQNIPIDGNLIKEKALSFAKNFDCPSFKASDGWLDKWKKR